MNLPFKVFHNFYRLAVLDNKEKSEKASLSDVAEALEDEM